MQTARRMLKTASFPPAEFERFTGEKRSRTLTLFPPANETV